MYFNHKQLAQNIISKIANYNDDICVSHTAGCGVPDTTPAPEIMYQYAQGEKGLTVTKK